MDEKLALILELLERHNIEFVNLRLAINQLRSSLKEVSEDIDMLDNTVRDLSTQIEYLRYSIK